MRTMTMQEYVTIRDQHEIDENRFTDIFIHNPMAQALHQQRGMLLREIAFTTNKETENDGS